VLDKTEINNTNDQKIDIQGQFSLVQSVTLETCHDQLSESNCPDTASRLHFDQDSTSLNHWGNRDESGESVMDLARSLHGAIYNTSSLRTSLEATCQTQDPTTAISSTPVSNKGCPPEDEITKEFHAFLMTFPDGSKKVSDWIENWNRKAKSHSTEHSLIGGERCGPDDDFSLHSTDSLRYYDRKRSHRSYSLDSETDA
jgi:hypothetical protein